MDIPFPMSSDIFPAKQLILIISSIIIQLIRLLKCANVLRMLDGGQIFVSGIFSGDK